MSICLNKNINNVITAGLYPFNIIIVYDNCSNTWMNNIVKKKHIGVVLERDQGPGVRKYLMTKTCLTMVLGHVIVVRYIFESVPSYDIS